LNKNATNAVELNWKMFGSSGFDKQPKSIRHSFIKRKDAVATNTKQIVNISAVHYLQEHYHIFHETTKDSEIIKNPEELALNHYPIMSREYFAKVKMTRGDVATNAWNNIRNWDYFAEYDHKEVEDTELAQLVPTLNPKKN
jgi:hypothetical protein